LGSPAPQPAAQFFDLRGKRAFTRVGPFVCSGIRQMPLETSEILNPPLDALAARFQALNGQR